MKSLFFFRIGDLYEKIDKYIESIPDLNADLSLDCPDIGEYCLVKHRDKFNRGKVIEVEYGAEIRLKVFCVDIGWTLSTELENVYNIPTELLKYIPFQVKFF